MIQIICGLDEVGRGSLSGPVVTAAVILNEGYNNPIITDSKKLTAKIRESLFDEICENSIFCITEKSNGHIDQHNVTYSTMCSFEESVLGLSVRPTLLKVDGNYFKTNLPIKYECIVKGDAKEKCIGAASIIAKVYRDRLMKNLHVDFPEYKWDTNVGYGTRAHIEAIKNYGLTKYHRKSFCHEME